MIKSGFIIAANYFKESKISIYEYIGRSRFTVLPWHLDLNLHVNNAIYLNFCNQARLEYLSSSGILRFLVRKKVNPIIFKNDIEYKKSLKLFDQFKIETKLFKVDKKVIVLEHRIIKEKTSVAICYSYARLVSKSKIDNLVLLKEFSIEKK